METVTFSPDGDYRFDIQGSNVRIGTMLAPTEGDRVPFVREVIEFGFQMRQLVEAQGTVTAISDQLKETAEGTRADMTAASDNLKQAITEVAAAHHLSATRFPLGRDTCRFVALEWPPSWHASYTKEAVAQ